MPRTVTLRYSIPGIGGSLGECIVCGGTFITELLLGQSIRMVRSETIDASLPAHVTCADLLLEISQTHRDWKLLPEGPLRRFYAELDAQQKEVADEARPHD